MFIIRHKSAMVITWLSRAVLTWPPMNQKFRNIGLWIKRDFNFGLLNRRFYRFYRFYRLTETLNLAQALLGTHPEILTGKSRTLWRHYLVIWYQKPNILIIWIPIQIKLIDQNWSSPDKTVRPVVVLKKWTYSFQIQLKEPWFSLGS